MRQHVFLTLVTVGLILPGIIANADDKTVSEISIADLRRVARVQEQQVLDALSRKVTLDVENEPLVEVVQRFSQIIEQDVLIDHSALAEAGISLDHPVHLTIGEVTGWQFLHFLLQPVELEWVADDGVLEITTRSAANERLVTTVYDIRALCQLLEPVSAELRWRRRIQFPIPAGGGGMFSIPSLATSSGLLAPVIGGGMGYGGPGLAEGIRLGPISVESFLREAIRQLPDLNWLDTDGEGGFIQAGHGKLIVSQKYQSHFQISAFLTTLEQMLNQKIHQRSVSIRRPGYPHEDDVAVFTALSQSTAFEFAEAELEQVLTDLAQTSGFKIWIDRKLLEEAGISLDQTVTLQTQPNSLSLGTGLKKLLDPLQLDFVVDEGLLVILTADRAKEMLTTRLYDLRECGLNSSDDLRGGVIPLVKGTTSGSWLIDDGEGGVAQMVSSRHLLVTQNQIVHAEIELLLDDLRSKPEELMQQKTEVHLQVYSVPDSEIANDLQEILPKIIGEDWVLHGSIHRAGRSLLINQTTLVHAKIRAIVDALENSQQRSRPAVIKSEPSTAANRHPAEPNE